MTTVHDESASTDPEQETGSMPEEKPATPRTRKKVTGAELEERFAGWTMRQRERVQARSPEDNARLIRRSVTAVMGVGILALVVATGVAGESFKASTADNEARVVQLKGQLDDARSTPVKADSRRAAVQAHRGGSRRREEGRDRGADLRHVVPPGRLSSPARTAGLRTRPRWRSSSTAGAWQRCSARTPSWSVTRRRTAPRR